MSHREKDTALTDYLAALQRLTNADVRTDAYTRILYSTDASIYQVMPLAVVLPRHVEEVHAAVELAARYRIPLLPRTSGSSLAGQAVNEAVVIDFSRHLNAILEVDPEARRVRVQPGIVLDELNHHLKPYGLQYGPDPASSNRAAMGGIVANNSTGSHSILYGMTADHVHSLSVILSDGSRARFEAVDEHQLEERKRGDSLEARIYRTVDRLRREHAETIRRATPRHWRRCGGYNLDRFVDGPTFRYAGDRRFNLAKLVCGSEGTLAVMTEITVNLVPLPRHTGLAIVQFERLYDALATTPVILETGPSAVELMDNLGLTLCREVPEYARLLKTFLDGEPNCILITEYYGDCEKEVRYKVEHLQDHLRRRRAPGAVVPVIEQSRQQNVWTVRKVGLGLMMSIKGDHKPIPFIEDAAVPVEHLAEYVTRVERFCNELGTQVAYYAHASGGCIHIRPLINTKDARDIAKLRLISEFAVSLLGQWGGALSSEHGDGRARSWLNERFFGSEMYALFKQVKQSFDPHNLLNPGIIVDGQPIDANLRYGADYRTQPLQTRVDFSDYQGFDRAVEMCNGAGICRKRLDGTMCPSFMVTREEMHSTRGRANALRAALSGRLPHSELTSKRMYEVMDLCIECKACKAECPSSVDMARIKFEFLVQYYQKHRIPLRTRLLGDLRPLQRAARLLGPRRMNRLLRSTTLRMLASRFVGLAPQRPLPPLAERSFTEILQSSEVPSNDQSRTTVTLFVDCFTGLFEPDVLVAAVQVLETSGFSVRPVERLCCARTMISKGLFDAAQRTARATVEALYQIARNGEPILCVEPGCFSALKDDHAHLGIDAAKVRTVSEAVWLFEDFLARQWKQQPPLWPRGTGELRILVHGHCHQKALVGTAGLRTVLQAIPGCRVEEVDSGCCGMAGSFGYEKEHFQLSLAMGERRLFPAVRSAGEETVIVAPGFSCRSQIRFGTGRKAQHPAQVLSRILAPLQETEVHAQPAQQS